MLDSLDIGQVTAMVAFSPDGNMEAVTVKTGNETNQSMLANSVRTSAFLHASGSGHIDIIKIMPRKGSPIDKQRSVRFTSLMAASLNGHGEIVKLLADNGAKLDLRNNDGASALIYAAQNGNSEVVKTLLENGADANLKDNNNKTALDYARNSDIRSLLEK